MSGEVIRYQFFFNSSKGVLNIENNFSYFKVYLNRILTLQNPDNQFVLSVEKLSIPYCFYQFNSIQGSSLLPYSIYVSGSSVYSGSISIPDGNYCVSDMGGVVASLLSTDIMANVPLLTGVSINWGYNSTTNRFSMQIVGSLYSGLVWELIIGYCAITRALGFAGILDAEAIIFEVNQNYLAGMFNVNMNPISEIYVTSNLGDNNAYQCFPKDQFQVETQITDIVAVVHLDHPFPYYIYKDFVNPIKIPIEKSSIDTIDFDLQDYSGNSLIGVDQSWNITFSISEVYTNKEAKDQTRKTYINSITAAQPPVPITQTNFLQRNLVPQPAESVNEFELETLRQKLDNSLQQLRANVQKRKSPATDTTTFPQSEAGAAAISNSNQPTIATPDAGQTEQTTFNIDGSAKRQRES